MRRHNLLAALAWSAALAAAMHAVACGNSKSDDTAHCTPGPGSCPAGQSCWAVDSAPHFACLASKVGASVGAACEATIGVATCGPGLVCDATMGDPKGGTCTAFCNSDNPCSSPAECHATHAGSASGPTLQICRSATAPDGGLSTSDASASEGGADRGPILKSDAGVTPQ